MNWTEILGFFAGCLTSASTVPQLIKAWKTKDVKDVSVLMFVVLLSGVSLWTIYGVIREDWPIIVTNSFSVLFNATMIFLKFRFNKEEVKLE